MTDALGLQSRFSTLAEGVRYALTPAPATPGQAGAAIRVPYVISQIQRIDPNYSYSTLGRSYNRVDAAVVEAALARYQQAEARECLAPGSTALSRIRYTQPGETFVRYESADPAFSRVTPTGGVLPGTYAAPASDGPVPIGQRVPTYNLPSPQIARPNAIVLRPPAGTPVIGPGSVTGGTGNEVIFPSGF